jgi:Na(+)-translocating NADH:ubiquinone oxidoreductase A subunit
MAVVRKARGFGGGMRLRRYAGQADLSLSALPVPVRVVIPLLQGFGLPVPPLVKPGDRVAAGQLIGRDDSCVGSPVHASVNGTVAAVGPIRLQGRTITAVTIDSDRTDSFARLEGHSARWHDLTPERIEELLYLSGVTGLGREGIPTRFRSSVIAPADARHFIALIPGADAFRLRPEVLLDAGGAERFIAGLRVIGRVLPGAALHVAASADNPRLLGSLSRLTAAADGIEFHHLSSKYPQDATEMAVTSVLGQEYPFGYSAANIGIVLADIQAVIAAHDAVVEGRPVIDRVVALAGPGFGAPTHVRARVGSSVEAVIAGRLRDIPTRILRDSLLCGTEVASVAEPVVRTDSLLIAAFTGAEREPFAFARPGLHVESWSRAFVSKLLPTGIVAETNRHGEERPCVQCGWCAEVCPVRIMPHLISRSLKFGINESLVNLGAFNCINCNLCTVVCPSKLPLARQLRETKARLLEVGCDNSSCVLPRFDLRGVEEYKGVRSVR